MDCDTVVNEFELKSRNNVHFRTLLEKALTPTLGKIALQMFFYKDGFGI